MQLNLGNFKLDNALASIIKTIVSNAKNLNYKVITETFLLKALLETDELKHFLESREIDIAYFTRKINEQLKEEKDIQDKNKKLDLIIPQELPVFSENYAFAMQSSKTYANYREINYAKLNKLTETANTIKAVDLIVALSMLEDRECFVKKFMQENGITQDTIGSFFSEIISGKAAINKNDTTVPPELQTFLTNLNTQAKTNPEQQIIGREAEIDRMIQILGRKKKNNPLILGDEGVGKTALVEGLAFKINAGEVPDYLKDRQIFSVDIGALVAGTKFRGDFEERLRKVLTFIQSDDKNMMFIDELHSICGTGANNEKTADMSNLLKPYLSKSLRCIGATTYKEAKAYIDKDAALARRFQKLDIAPPSPAQTVTILKKIKEFYEQHHKVTYNDNIIELIVNLANKYIANKNFPDKAIDILDEVGVLVKHNNKLTVEKRDVQQVVASISNIDINSLVAEDQDVIMSLHSKLSERVIDQEDAVDKVCETIYLDRAGLLSHSKPKGIFLFSGPTGVGKTETAKAIADAMNMKLLRFDMSEYMDKHSSSKLIGTTSGYVGYEDGGVLTTTVAKNPYSVVLLDEIEKAHTDIYTLLLQVFDHGFIKDGQGRDVDFRNTIIIMTTNAGASNVDASSKIGFMNESTDDTLKTKYDQAIKSTFAPEFRGRLDAIVNYKALNKEHMQKVLDKFISQIVKQVQEDKGIQLEVSASMSNYLLEHGFNARLGARPLAKALRDNVQVPLSKAILFDGLKQGQTIVIDRADEKNVVVVKELELA